jgi:protein TonB
VSGKATVECYVISGGLLDKCSVLDESPAGYGFGAAAIQLAFEHYVRADPEGRYGLGKKVAVPIDFKPPR